MFWGVTLETGKRYSQRVEESYHLTMAALEPPKETNQQKKGSKYVSIMVEHEKSDYMICTLEPNRNLQVQLDLMFVEGDTVTYYLNGEGTVHLTGYLVGPDDLDDFDEEDDLEDESSEEEVEVNGKLPKTNKRKNEALESSPEVGKKAKVDPKSVNKDSKVNEIESKASKKINEKKNENNVPKKNIINKKAEEEEDDSDEDEDDDISDANETSLGLIDSEAAEADDSDEEEEDEESDEESDNSEEQPKSSPIKPKQNQIKQDPKQNNQRPQQQNQSNFQKSPQNQNNRQPFGSGQKGGKFGGQQKGGFGSGQKGGFQQNKGQWNQSGQKNQNQNRGGNQWQNRGQSGNQNNSPSFGGKGGKQQSPNFKGGQRGNFNQTPKFGGQKGSHSKQNKKQWNSDKKDQNSENQNKKQKKLSGGIIVEDLVEGSGSNAGKGKFVHVNYVGRLPDKRVFDKTHNKPFSFRLGRGEVIKGWDIGLQGMKVGGKRKIIIPANMGYGNRSVGTIPANSTLEFDVELKSVT